MPIFLVADGVGLSRAAQSSDGGWIVTRLKFDARPHAVAAGPSPLVAYAGTTNGVAKSDDAGHTWRAAGLVGLDVRAVAVSPAQPELVFAGTRPCALYSSRDGGANWAELPSFRRLARFRAFFSPAEWPPIPYVSAIALSAGDPLRLVVGMEVGGVAASGDGGTTWQVGRGAIYDCHSLAAHPTDAMRFYEGGAGLRKAGRTSADGGLTWSGPRSQDGKAYGWASLGAPADPATWYYAASTGPFKAHSTGVAEAALYRVRNDGPAERLQSGLPYELANMPYQLASRGVEIYMGLANGEVWQSPPDGESWRRLPFTLSRIERALAVL